MANVVGKALPVDTAYDNEATMAVPSGDEGADREVGRHPDRTGPWIQNEAFSISGTIHRLTGIPCPSCRVNPECRGNSYLSNYCASCGWFGVPF